MEALHYQVSDGKLLADCSNCSTYPTGCMSLYNIGELPPNARIKLVLAAAANCLHFKIDI